MTRAALNQYFTPTALLARIDAAIGEGATND